jgi:hypothetical protein
MEELSNNFSMLNVMQAFGLLEPSGEVKGLFVAVPQIERNRATLKRATPQTEATLAATTTSRAPFSVIRNVTSDEF